MKRGLKFWLVGLAAAGFLTTIFVAGAFSATADPAYAADDVALYNGQCAKCHGRDGRSKTSKGRSTHSRDLTNGDWQNDVSDERIYNSIRNGKGKMPSFKKLSESQIDSLVRYVRRLGR